jgi:polyhydroxyalkanoate depolymerase
MIYQTYQACADLALPARGMAALAALAMRSLGPLAPPVWGHAAAAWDLVARSGLAHERPPFAIGEVRVGPREMAVREEVAARTPFATLRRFRKDGDGGQPRVLLIAPMSGHFPTLLRDTIRTMLPEHDVYITDWHNARDVPLAHGAFGLDDFIACVIRFLEAVGPGAHVVAVCQPCPAVLAAVAAMAEGHHPAQPRSMTLMAGPVDARVNPTRVNELATRHPLDWFRRHLIASVPWPHRGAGRRVYPGFIQLAAFLSMNPARHLRAQAELYRQAARGEARKARAARAFYDEYFTVTDLPAEFYLETVQRVFQDHRLALGRLEWRGQRIDPRAIQRTALLTVEGERDDICAAGQTVAAHDLCTGLPPSMRRHHLQAGAGHYGVFTGRRWRHEVYPQLRSAIRLSSGR